MHLGQHKSTLPTVGFNKPRTIDVKGRQTKLFDIGGAAGFRDCWPDKLARAHGVIFVVDAANKARFIEARDELSKYLTTDRFKGKPFLILANKQDKDDHAPTEEVVKALKIKSDKFNREDWYALGCSASKRDKEEPVDRALREGIEWLMEALEKKWEPIRERVAAEAAKLDAKLERERKENAKAVAEKKKKAQQTKAGVKKNSVVPITPEDTPLCTNMLTMDNKRVPCERVATTRNAQSGWQSVCDECFLQLSEDRPVKPAKKSAKQPEAEGKSKAKDNAKEDTSPDLASSNETEAKDTLEETENGFKVGDACEFPIWQRGVLSRIEANGILVIATPDGRAFEIPVAEIRAVSHKSQTIAIQGKGIRPALATDSSHDEEQTRDNGQET